MNRTEFAKLVNEGNNELNRGICVAVNNDNKFIGSYRGKRVWFHVRDVNSDGTLVVDADFTRINRLDPKHVFNAEGKMFTDLFAEYRKRY